ncbi:hypothetical protein EDB89DRAFT_109429 [Lactarius sanguifluus]|nr:hypothetical protein EDB89DRAFT_109429 [Lactarius sanguifluus]
MFTVSLEISARVSFTNRRVLPLVAAGVDADAATLGFIELCVNAVANAWYLGLSFSSSSSSLSSTTTTVSLAAFFVFFPLGPVLTAPASCSQTQLAVRVRVPSNPNYPLPAVWRQRVRGRWRNLTCERRAGAAVRRPTPLTAPILSVYWFCAGYAGDASREEEEEVSMDMVSNGSWSPSVTLAGFGRSAFGGGREEEWASLRCGVREHGIARTRSAWRHLQKREGADSVARRMYAHRKDGREWAHLKVTIAHLDVPFVLDLFDRRSHETPARVVPGPVEEVAVMLLSHSDGDDGDGGAKGGDDTDDEADATAGTEDLGCEKNSH